MYNFVLPQKLTTNNLLWLEVLLITEVVHQHILYVIYVYTLFLYKSKLEKKLFQIVVNLQNIFPI